MRKQPTGGVVVCRERLAAEVGQAIIEQGGNAIDAAIAAAYAQGVVNPMACGLGGTGNMNLYLAPSQEHLLVQAMGGAGERARPDTFEYTHETQRAGRWAVKDQANYISHQASTIPTFVRVTGEAHRLFGRLPWADLLAPAIQLASAGFDVPLRLARGWDMHAKGAFDWPSGMQTLTATDACARIYLKDGRFYQEGERLVQSDYAQTLRRLASEGPDVFYAGDIGQTIAQDFADHDGLFTYADLLRCRATLARPLSSSYRDYTLHGSGPIRLLMYNILEGFDLRSLGHNTPQYLDIVARALQIASIDRAKYSADAQVEDVPTQMLISKAHAAELRARIESGDDLKNVEPGSVPYFGTTGVVAMDEAGNTVAMSHSNGNGSGVVTPGLGFLYNNHMHNFNPRPGFLYNNHMHNFNPRPGFRNSIAPGKNPVGAAGGPLIACYQGQPVIAMAHHSRAGTTSEIQIFLNMVEFGMPIEAAVAQPRIHAEYRQRTVFVDPGFPADLIEGIEALGTQRVTVGPITPAVAAVHHDPASGSIAGGWDPRGEGGMATVNS